MGTKCNFEINASMMCADFGHLFDEVMALEKAGVDSLRKVIYC